MVLKPKYLSLIFDDFSYFYLLSGMRFFIFWLGLYHYLEIYHSIICDSFPRCVMTLTAKGPRDPSNQSTNRKYLFKFLDCLICEVIDILPLCCIVISSTTSPLAFDLIEPLEMVSLSNAHLESKHITSSFRSTFLRVPVREEDDEEHLRILPTRSRETPLSTAWVYLRRVVHLTDFPHFNTIGTASCVLRPR